MGEPSSSDLPPSHVGRVVSPPLSHSTTNSPPQTQCSSPSSSNNAVNAPKFGTLVPNRIFVGGLAVTTTDADLSQLFSGHGAVKSAKVIVDRALVSKGYGFVTFSNEDDAKKLIQTTDHINHNGRPLNIAPAIKKQPFTSNSYENVSTPQPMPYAAPHPPMYYAGSGQYSYSQPYSSLYMAQQMQLAELNPSMYQGYGQPAMTATMAHHSPTPAGYQLVYPQQPPMYMAPPQQFSVPYQPFNMVNQQASTWVDPGMTAQYQVSPCQPYLVPMY